MELIPVIDLMGGQVVRGVRGNRGAYRPIESALCRGSDPARVAATLVDHCAARCLYVADLDALMGGEPQWAALRAVAAALRDTAAARPALWVDAGFRDAGAARAWRAAMGDVGAGIDLVPVFASEALPDARSLAEATGAFADGVLSLDRRDGRPLDAAGCWTASAHWPRHVIVMTLERVGADSGPDLDTLAAVRARHAGVRLVGAGGIRGQADLAAAAAAGAHAWLVASALHDLRLPRVDR